MWRVFADCVVAIGISDGRAQVGAREERDVKRAVSRSAYHKIGDFRKTSRKIAFWTHQHPPDVVTRQ